MPKQFFSRYTHDLTSEELGKLFTRETPEAYQFFARGINTAELEGLPWHQRTVKYAQAFFLAFTMRLSPARRLMYGVSLGLVGDRPLATLPGIRHGPRAGSDRAVLHSRARARPDVSEWHDVAPRRIPADEPAGAARGRRSPVAEA